MMDEQISEDVIPRTAVKEQKKRPTQTPSLLEDEEQRKVAHQKEGEVKKEPF
jgi:hypothetical protein